MAKATPIVGQTFLGLGLLLGGMALVPGWGGLGALWGLVVVAVLCTAGIGLLPLLGVAWAIGWVAWHVIEEIRGSFRSPQQV